MNLSSHCCQVHPEGKFVVDVDKNIDINDVSTLSCSFLLFWFGTVKIMTTKQL